MEEGWWKDKGKWIIKPNKKKGIEGVPGTGEYKRRSTRSISYFCGWESLLVLLSKCSIEIEKALIATLFESGGRASEVLSLKRDQFIDKGKYILITGMLVLKQRKEENRFRQVAIMKKNPLTKPMMDWVKEQEGFIFPYKYDWLYKHVCKIDKDWWPHRFRAERASQLAIENDFGVIELMKWFGWSSERMATHYAKMSVKDLVEKMSRGEL